MISDKDHKKQLGLRLRLLREKAGLIQSEVADAIGSTRDSISNYEVGRANPKPKDLAALADLFHTTIDYILGKTDDSLPFFSRLSLDFRELLDKMSKDGEFFDYIKEDVISALERFKDQFEEGFSYTPDELAKEMDEDYSLYFKGELYGDIINVAIKHGIVEGKNKNSDPLANERELVSAIVLSDENTLNNSIIIVDGIQLTERQKRKLLAMVRLDLQADSD